MGRHKKKPELTSEEAALMVIDDMERRLEQIEDDKRRYKWVINTVRKLILGQKPKYPTGERWYKDWCEK